MTAQQYATALRDALEGKTASQQGKVTTQFLQSIRQKHHEKLLPEILRKLKRIRPSVMPETLIVAKRKDVAAARKEAGTKVGAIIDSNLIGGWQHYKDGVLTDASYKRSLTELYRNITT